MPFDPEVWDRVHRLVLARAWAKDSTTAAATITTKGAPMRRMKTTTKRTKKTPTTRPSAWIEPVHSSPPERPFMARPYSYEIPQHESAWYVAEVSPCRVCGGEADDQDDRYGPWRMHAQCGDLRQEWQRLRAVAQWYSVPLPPEVEAYVDLRVPNYAEAHPEPVYADGDRDRTPWSHLRRRDVIRAVMTARIAYNDARTPKPCEWGRCAWCGRDESLTWTDAGHRWPDGSPAPLCDSCTPVAERRGWPSPNYPDDARPALVEVMTSVPAQAGEAAPAGVLALHEVGQEAGNGQPWSHLPVEAVAALRWERWATLNGKYAPDDKRAEALARRAAAEAERAASLAAAGTDPYGFATKADRSE